MLSLFKPIAKAIAAGLVPLLLPLLHKAGAVEMSASGLEVLLASVFGFVFVWLAPKNQPADSA